jgi:hypothetical protein
MLRHLDIQNLGLNQESVQKCSYIYHSFSLQYVQLRVLTAVAVESSVSCGLVSKPTVWSNMLHPSSG